AHAESIADDGDVEIMDVKALTGGNFAIMLSFDRPPIRSSKPDPTSRATSGLSSAMRELMKKVPKKAPMPTMTRAKEKPEVKQEGHESTSELAHLEHVPTL